MMTARSLPRSRDRAYRAERVDDPAGLAASLLAEGQIVGWFQGRMEFGPRALAAARCSPTLAAPRCAMCSTGASSTASRSGRSAHRSWPKMPADWFASRPTGRGRFVPGPDDPGLPCPPGASIARSRPCCTTTAPAASRSSTQRNPLFHALISRFRELSGVPLVLNTSFNDQEPLVASPEDALRTFATDVRSMPSFWEITLSGDVR